MKKGDRVRVSKDFPNHYWTPDPAGYVCVVIAEGYYVCARRNCHPNCERKAVFVRTLKKEASFKRKVRSMRPLRYPRYGWNHDANKVCTAYLEPVRTE